MNVRHLLICAAILATSCVTNGPAVPGGSGDSWWVEDSALSWLAQQQCGDGHWGKDEHRVALTGLATLAFISQGETPASDKYGKTMEKALRALVRDAKSDTEESDETKALLTWCLAEAYLTTNIPMLLEAANVQAAKMDFTHPSPWHVLAAWSLTLCGAGSDLTRQGLSTMRSDYPSQTDRMLDQAIHLLLAIDARDREQAVSYLDAVRRLAPADWRTQQNPLPTTVMLSKVLAMTDGKDWQDWHNPFAADVKARQLRRGSRGWWTAVSLGLAVDSLPALQRTDRDVYVTSMILLTLPPPRSLPSFETRTLLDKPFPGAELNELNLQ